MLAPQDVHQSVTIYWKIQTPNKEEKAQKVSENEILILVLLKKQLKKIFKRNFYLSQKHGIALTFSFKR